MSYLWDEQIVSNVFHVESGGDWTTAALELLADTLVTWAVTELIPNMASTVTLEHVEAKDIGGEAGEAVVVPCIGTCSGNGTNGPALPNNVTVAVKWLTGLSGRSFRGRTYHIGLTENQVTDNELVPIFDATLSDAYLALLDAIAAADPTWEMVVASFVADGVPRVTGVTTPILDSQIDPVVDSQRRRLPGRGR